jgi:hypothetical protein
MGQIRDARETTLVNSLRYIYYALVVPSLIRSITVFLEAFQVNVPAATDLLQFDVDIKFRDHVCRSRTL